MKLKRGIPLFFMFFILLMAVLISITPLAASTTETLTASADAYVKSNAGDSNYGSDTELFAANQVNGADEITYIKFDLSGISSGSVIVSAKLKLWITSGGSCQICVYRVTSDWSENSVTYNTRPSASSESETCVSVGGLNTWAEFDITDLVQAWVNGTYDNYGVKIFPSESGKYAHFASREYSDSSKRPQLVIEYVEPVTVTQTVTETVTETTTVASTTYTETETMTETITTTQTINNTIYSTVTTTTTVANTTYYTTIYETVSPTYGNQTANYYTDLANQLIPLVMVIGVICSLLGLLLSATGGRR